MPPKSPDPPRARARAGCEHADLEFLGSEGNAMYYRCKTCGDSVVVQGDQRWVVPASKAKRRE